MTRPRLVLLALACFASAVYAAEPWEFSSNEERVAAERLYSKTPYLRIYSDADEQFKRGDSKGYAGALARLRWCVLQDPDSGPKKRNRLGVGKARDYYPYYYIALVLARQQDWSGAVRAFERENAAAIATSRYSVGYQRLEQKLKLASGRLRLVHLVDEAASWTRDGRSWLDASGRAAVAALPGRIALLREKPISPRKEEEDKIADEALFAVQQLLATYRAELAARDSALAALGNEVNAGLRDPAVALPPRSVCRHDGPDVGAARAALGRCAEALAAPLEVAASRACASFGEGAGQGGEAGVMPAWCHGNAPLPAWSEIARLVARTATKSAQKAPARTPAKSPPKRTPKTPPRENRAAARTAPPTPADSKGAEAPAGRVEAPEEPSELPEEAVPAERRAALRAEAELLATLAGLESRWSECAGSAPCGASIAELPADDADEGAWERAEESLGSARLCFEGALSAFEGELEARARDAERLLGAAEELDEDEDVASASRRVWHLRLHAASEEAGFARVAGQSAAKPFGPPPSIEALEAAGFSLASFVTAAERRTLVAAAASTDPGVRGLALRAARATGNVRQAWHLCRGEPWRATAARLTLLTALDQAYGQLAGAELDAAIATLRNTALDRAAGNDPRAGAARHHALALLLYLKSQAEAESSSVRRWLLEDAEAEWRRARALDADTALPHALRHAGFTSFVAGLS